MATVKVTDAKGVDFDAFPLLDSTSGTVATHTATKWHVDGAGQATEYAGIGFTYDANHDLTGGMVSTVTWTSNQVVEFQVTGLKLPGATIAGAADGTDLLSKVLAGNDTITGGAGNDHLLGFDGNDVIDGGKGNDTMEGGAGNDTYIVDSLGDVVTEDPNAGIDTVKTSALITTAYAEVENYIFTGKGNWTFTGNDADNVITGGAGNDKLDGGKGDDTLIGGAGNDTYFVDSAKDVVIDSSGTSDTIVSSILPTGLTAGIENYTYTGASDWTFTGTAGNNILVGGTGSDTLDGGKGNDTLNAGTAGTDTLTGGQGDDTYVIDHTGVTVVEAAKDGTDTVQASITIDLTGAGFAGQEIENVTLTGSAKIDATGNDLDNVFIGNSADNKLDGGNGDDTLYGGTAGADTLIGGAGNDTYLIDHTGVTVTEGAAGGTDTIQSIITIDLTAAGFKDQEIENVTLFGGSNIKATGNDLDNVLTGNSGSNTLDGGKGNDTLIGGDGSDTYEVDSAGDKVVELAGAKAGTHDLIESSILLTGTVANVEDYTYKGTADWTFTGSAASNFITGGGGNDTLDGGKGDDILIGGAGNDAMTGGAGNDQIDGGTGDDKLIGGAGNDSYWVDSASDTVTDSAGGFDRVISSNIAFTDLISGIEGYYYLGANNWTFTGNAADNVLWAGSGADKLDGGKGNDVLNGGSGADDLTGGTGNDIYLIDNSGDRIHEDAKSGIDLVETSLATTDLVQDAIYGDQEIEELLLLTGAKDAVGNKLNNIIEGNVADNKISGGDGNDVLWGEGGNDKLDGGKGNDTLIGGDGNDTYEIDSTGDRVLLEGAGGNSGTHDLIESTILLKTTVANVEDYTYTGKSDWTFTGSDVANIIIGGTGHNTLSGGKGDDTLTGNALSDTLNGGLGNDTLIGGDGNDTYLIDSKGDKITEISGQGIDTAKISTLDVTAAAAFNEVENFIFTGKGNWTFTGNTLDNSITGHAGSDTLDGGDGNDTLNGGIGADHMTGGKGDDTFIVDNLGDTVAEANGEGTDTILTSIAIKDATNYANVENFTFTGKGNWTFTANAEDNAVHGGAGNDHLNGGDGDDTAVFSGNLADYKITTTADGVIVTDLNGATHGADGTDTLVNFEHLKFADQTVDLPAPTLRPASDLTSRHTDAATLHIADVLDIAGHGHVPTINGGHNDTLSLSTAHDSNNSPDTAILTGHAVHANHGAAIAIEADIHVTVG